MTGTKPRQVHFQQISLHAEIRIHPLQSTVLIFHGLHLADQGRIHAPILRSPLIEKRVAHAMLAAKLSNRHTAFSLAQDRKGLELAISGQLHAKSPHTYC